MFVWILNHPPFAISFVPAHCAHGNVLLSTRPVNDCVIELRSAYLRLRVWRACVCVCMCICGRACGFANRFPISMPKKIIQRENSHNAKISAANISRFDFIYRSSADKTCRTCNTKRRTTMFTGTHSLCLTGSALLVWCACASVCMCEYQINDEICYPFTWKIYRLEDI